MNLAKKIFLLLLITLFLAVGLVFSRSAEKEEKKPAAGPPPAGVEVVRVEKRAVQSVIQLVGTVGSPRISLVSTELEGLVKDVLFEEGDFVNRGKLLIALEDSQLGILLEEVKEKLVENEALWETAKSQLKRNEELFQKKVISEKIHTDSKLAEEAAKSIYEQSKIKVRLLEDRIEKKKIVSPFAGVVIEKSVERGEWIQRGGNIARLVQIDPLWIEVLVPEEVIPRVKKGDVARISFDALNQENTEGRVSFILPVADPKTRTFPVRIELKNPDRRYKVGMVARASLSYGKEEAVLLVPQDALTIFGNNKVITVVTQEKTAKIVPVKVVKNIDGWLEVKGEVSEDDLVVVRGNERLRPGQPVMIINQEGKK
jgi:RND family efflux transporter MFP subunit